MAETLLNGKTVLMVIPHLQFRDEEFFGPKKQLEDAGAKVVVASASVRTCHSMNGGATASQIAIAEAKADDYNALVICGGSSVPEFLWNDKKLQELAATMATAGKVMAAICLSTVVLARAKVLAGLDATVYFLPQAIQELTAGGARYVKEPLVVQKNIILAEGPAESARWGQAICSALA